MCLLVEATGFPEVHCNSLSLDLHVGTRRSRFIKCEGRRCSDDAVSVFGPVFVKLAAYLPSHPHHAAPVLKNMDLNTSIFRKKAADSNWDDKYVVPHVHHLSGTHVALA